MSGGGARGAYEAGVVRGILDVVGAELRSAPFRIIAGTSVGALNGAYLVANAHHADHAIDGLLGIWRCLDLKTHFRFKLGELFGIRSPLKWLRRADNQPETYGRSVLDTVALENIIRASIDWNQLHTNIREDLVRAFVIATLHIGTGLTTLFAEISDKGTFRRSTTQKLSVQLERITPGHVMASAAIPLLFPARRLGDSYYVDGGLRFNTPIASAIHAGAGKLVVINLSTAGTVPEPPEFDEDGMERYPHMLFLLGKVFDALLVDPPANDVSNLERINEIMQVLDTVLTPAQQVEFAEKLRGLRGSAYRRIDTLTFTPTEDIGKRATEHLKQHLDDWTMGRIYEALFSRVANGSSPREADLASYLMFDGSWANELISIGRQDALRKKEEIRAFFSC